jgi:hypothetical protein
LALVSELGGASLRRRRAYGELPGHHHQ